MKKHRAIILAGVLLMFGFFAVATPAHAAVATDVQTQEQLALLSNYLSLLQKLYSSLQNLLFSPIPSAYATSTGPVILSNPTSYITNTNVQISWSTDIVSDSSVSYGTQNTPSNFPYGSINRCDAGGNVTAHCINLTGLAPSTSYYFKVDSCVSGQGCGEQTGSFYFVGSTSPGTCPTGQYWQGDLSTGYCVIGTPPTSCPSNIASLLGSGCHDMYAGYYFNAAMDQYVPYHGSAVSSCAPAPVSGCSGGGIASSTCPTAALSLLGSGCHDMYAGYYFNAAMDQYVPYGGSTIYSCSTTYVSGCTGSGTASSTTSVPGIPTMSVPSTSGIPVNVSWSVPTGASWYNLSHRTPSGSTNAWTLVGSTLSGTSYSDSSVVAGASYDYRVVACNSYGCSTDSSSASVTISGGTADTQPPSTPPVPTLNIIASSPNQTINLSWSASTDNVGVTGYKIYRCTCGNTANMVYLASVTGTSYSDTGLAGFTTYTYAVAAYDAAGNTSPQGPGASGTTYGSDATPPSTPTGLSATNYTPSYSSFNLHWAPSTDNVGVTGYKLYQNGTFILDTGSASNKVEVDTLSAGTATYPYSYTVAAYDAAGNLSPQSTNFSTATLFSSSTASSTISGACELRGGSASAPASSAPDVGYQYAKMVKSGINDLTGLRSACTAANFDYLTQQYCTQNTLSSSNYATQEVVTYSSNGNVSSVGGADGYGGLTTTVRTICLMAPTSTTPSYGSALNLAGVTNLLGKIWGPGSNGIVIGGGLNFSTQVGVGWSQQYGGIYATSYSIQNTGGSYYLAPTSPVSVTVTGPAGSIIEAWDLETLTVVAANITSPGSPVAFTAQPNHRYGGFAWYADNSQKNIAIYAAYSSAPPTNSTCPTGQYWYVPPGGVGYCTSSTSTSTSTYVACPSVAASLLGSGCHDMYAGYYFNAAMTQYVPYSGSTIYSCGTTYVSGCVTSGGYATSTTSYACPTGQYWYVPPGGVGYCALSTSTTTSTYVAPPGQRQQIWNTLGLQSWVRTDADPARITQLQAACANVSPNSSVYVWTPNAGNFSSVDFGMPDALKCQQAASGITQVSCPLGQYWYVPPGGVGYCTYTSSQAPTVDLKVDGSDGSVYRTAPASYTLNWNTTGNPTSCVPSGTWSNSGSKGSFGSQQFVGVTVTGTKTYALVCSNAYGSSTDTVTVEVTAAPSFVSTSSQSTYNPFLTTTPISQSQGGFVQGFVSDGSGQSLAGVFVHVFTEDFSLNFSSVTGATGGLFGMNIPAGTYLIEASPPSARTDLIRRAPQKFSIGNGEVKTLSLQFDAPSKTISGSVTFSSGDPITDAEVGAYSSETNQWTKAFTDGNGKFTLRVSGGTWQVGIRPRDPISAKWTWAGDIQQVVFGSTSGEEVRTVNFVILVSDAKLTVHALDQSGNVVQSAGIVVDSIGAGQKPTGTNLPPPTFRKADASGSASFLLMGGTYYVRAFLPSELGYFNPDEQQIVLAARQTKDVSLVFRKYETVANRVSLIGTTKLDDGTLTSAFVWAWSEGGDTAQMRSGEDGTFTFQATVGRWHLGAGKEVGGFPYKSGELTVDVQATTPSVDIVLAKIGNVKLPPPVEVSQSATQQIIAQAQDGAKVTVPEGGAQSSGNVNVEVKPTIEAPSQAAAKVVSTVYDVSITGDTGNAVTSLQKEIEITIPYNEEDLKKQGVTEDTFVPSYYDETTGTWVKVDNYTIDKEKKVVIMRVKHLTRFALVAAADITPPDAPTHTSAKIGQPGEVVISWVNPVNDFSHVKVYRSVVTGELGKIVANDVTGVSTSDTDVVSGTKYYYTVRAVDPAGNESVNTAQIPLTASGVFAGVKSAGGALSRKLSQGASGDDVTALQGLLIKEGFLTGSATGYFGALTKAAVIKFQEKYAAEILTPVGLMAGTGSVGPATMAKVNQLLGGNAAPALVQNASAGQAPTGNITRTLQVGSSGDDVTALQGLLIKEGLLSSSATGYFGELTKAAVIKFQEKYASEVLTPNGLTAGTGTVGPSTRNRINQLLK